MVYADCSYTHHSMQESTTGVTGIQAIKPDQSTGQLNYLYLDDTVSVHYAVYYCALFL